MLRRFVVFLLLVLCLWGVALGAWVSTILTLGLSAIVAFAGARVLRIAAPLLVLAIGVLGTGEVLWCMDHIGRQARNGALSPRHQVAVYGFNGVFGSAAMVMGFPAFGRETLALGIPWSSDGPCPQDRVARYGRHLPHVGVPQLRRWHDDLPMRSPRLRQTVRGWARALPATAAEGSRRSLGPVGPLTWDSSAYFDASEANAVPIALNAPTTRMSGVAEKVGERWRLDLAVDLALAYPERATLQLGPFALEEGMFYDARALLRPYCAELYWSVWHDDPALDEPGPLRGPIERATTALLRELGARYP